MQGGACLRERLCVRVNVLFMVIECEWGSLGVVISVIFKIPFGSSLIILQSVLEFALQRTSVRDITPEKLSLSLCGSFWNTLSSLRQCFHFFHFSYISLASSSIPSLITFFFTTIFLFIIWIGPRTTVLFHYYICSNMDERVWLL